MSNRSDIDPTEYDPFNFDLFGNPIMEKITVSEEQARLDAWNEAARKTEEAVKALEAPHGA